MRKTQKKTKKYRISGTLILMGNKRMGEGRFNRHVPEKANRILHLIFIAIVLLLVRIWHLTVIDHDHRNAQSLRPTRKKVVEPARRATIRDRFNLPLAMNRVQYNVAIHYGRIREIPEVKWETPPNGVRTKRYPRREHIHKLSHFLAQELHMEPSRIEDLLHAKAALYDQLPFPLQYNLSEEQYYRLKARERDWIGLQTIRAPQRYYPMGPVAGDILGYMGAIQLEQLNAIFGERRQLKEYLSLVALEEDAPLPAKINSPEEAQARLNDLEDKAYSAQDFVGKTGIEGLWEEELRGFQGKQFFYTDAKGRFLRALVEKEPPLPGRRILLTLSAELQRYAEELLIRNEQIRSARVAKPYMPGEKPVPHKEPWIKGGAIVAMDPHTGEILALASYPRIDPNDFIPSGNAPIDSEKRARVRSSLELESHLGSMWEGKRPLEREKEDLIKGLSKESQFLTWNFFLSSLLDEESSVSCALSRVNSMGTCAKLLKTVEALQNCLGETDLAHIFNRLYAPDGHISELSRLRGSRKEAMEEQCVRHAAEIAALKAQLDPFLSSLTHTYDKLLLIDLLGLLCQPKHWTPPLLAACGSMTLSDYYTTQQAFFFLDESVKLTAKELFHKTDFALWRKEHFDAYLKQKRLEEKLAKRRALPMTDYLQAEEKAQFETFWQEASSHILYAFLHEQPLTNPLYRPYLTAEKEHLLSSQEPRLLQAYKRLAASTAGLSSPIQEAYFQTFRPFNALNATLYGRYRGLRQDQGEQKQKHLAIAWYPKCGHGYGRSWCYRQATVQGSIFKLIPSYQALIERYHHLGSPQFASRDELNPLTIIDRPHLIGGKWHVGYTEKGESIPQFYKGGRLLRSMTRNIGTVDMIRALESSSNAYFDLLAVDHISSPTTLEEVTRQFSYGCLTGIDLPGETKGNVPNDLEENRTGLYNFAIGQHTLVVTPLQTAVMLAAIGNEGRIVRPHVVHRFAGRKRAYSAKQPQSSYVTTIAPTIERQLLMPGCIRDILLEGLKEVSHHLRTQGIGALRTLYKSDPAAISAFLASEGSMVGKTSTGESTERLSLERLTGTQTYNHVWFGALFFDPEEKHQASKHQEHFGKTDLVVVVYLRYGGLGKEAIPLAAQVAEKWREIQKRHGQAP